MGKSKNSGGRRKDELISELEIGKHIPDKILNVSIILAVAEPFWPALGAGAAGPGPGPGRVVLWMPLEYPQLLEPHLSDGPVHENAIDRLAVPVYAQVVRLPG